MGKPDRQESQGQEEPAEAPEAPEAPRRKVTFAEVEAAYKEALEAENRGEEGE